MNEQKKTKGAKWFGIPNLVPYMRPYGKLIFWMVLMAFYGSAMDAVIPLFQQYAIDHYIADSTLAGSAGHRRVCRRHHHADGLQLYLRLRRVQAGAVRRRAISSARASTICRRSRSPTSIRTASAMSTRASCPIPTVSRARSPGAWPRACGIRHISCAPSL